MRNVKSGRISLLVIGYFLGRHPFFRWWVLAFFRSWNSEGLLLLRSKLFLLSPAPIHTNTRGGDQNMQGIGCYALKISMIEKTPTPHHRKNAALPVFLAFLNFSASHLNAKFYAIPLILGIWKRHHLYKFEFKLLNFLVIRYRYQNWGIRTI